MHSLRHSTTRYSMNFRIKTFPGPVMLLLQTFLATSHLPHCQQQHQLHNPLSRMTVAKLKFTPSTCAKCTTIVQKWHKLLANKPGDTSPHLTTTQNATPTLRTVFGSAIYLLRRRKLHSSAALHLQKSIQARVYTI